ncbi:hypothetical protein ACFQV2_28370 [Actinokineospora soli]|uniref:Tetratricopeptide repeat-containing protein n=1 Tax=Actinokineospora soli TaxID=1048753 RepID=A0ABW2TTI3_9PSEU
MRALAAMIAISPDTARWARIAAEGFRERGDARGECHPLWIEGIAVAYLGDLDASRRTLSRMVALGERAGETYYSSMARFGVAYVEVNLGDADAAAEAARLGLRGVVRLDDRLGLAFQLDGHAWVAARKRDYRRAAVLFGCADRAWARWAPNPTSPSTCPASASPGTARTRWGSGSSRG